MNEQKHVVHFQTPYSMNTFHNINMLYGTKHLKLLYIKNQKHKSCPCLPFFFKWLPKTHYFLLRLRLVDQAHLMSGLFYLQYRPPRAKRHCEFYSILGRSKLYRPK